MPPTRLSPGGSGGGGWSVRVNLGSCVGMVQGLIQPIDIWVVVKDAIRMAARAGCRLMVRADEGDYIICAICGCGAPKPAIKYCSSCAEKAKVGNYRSRRPKGRGHRKTNGLDTKPIPTICPTCGECYGPPGGGGEHQAKRRYTHRVDGKDYNMFMCACGKEWHQYTHTPVEKPTNGAV